MGTYVVRALRYDGADKRNSEAFRWDCKSKFPITVLLRLNIAMMNCPEYLFTEGILRKFRQAIRECLVYYARYNSYLNSLLAKKEDFQRHSIPGAWLGRSRRNMSREGIFLSRTRIIAFLSGIWCSDPSRFDVFASTETIVEMDEIIPL